MNGARKGIFAPPPGALGSSQNVKYHKSQFQRVLYKTLCVSEMCSHTDECAM